MSVPPTANDASTQPPGDNATGRSADAQPSETEWAHWEQTFRDARPVLSEAAVARIESGMRREMAAVPARAPKRATRWALLALIAAAIGVGFAWIHFQRSAGPLHSIGRPSAAVRIADRYPLAAPIGPQLFAPNLPVLPLREYADLIDGSGRATTAPAIGKASASRPDVTQNALRVLHAAEKLSGNPPDAWHALGLLEMRRAAGMPVGAPVRTAMADAAYRLDFCWRLLPVKPSDVGPFSRALSGGTAAGASPQAVFWDDVFTSCVAQLKGQSPARLPSPPGSSAGFRGPLAFPSRGGEQARFDLLVKLGLPEAQAGLSVLTSRSYEPLRALKQLDGAIEDSARRKDLQAACLSASHDLIERIFALRLAGRAPEATELLRKAKQLRYLNDPQDLAILLARLGPDDAWNKLVHPLLMDEADFIQNPPDLSAIAPAHPPQAIVQADAKRTEEGVTTYTGHVEIAAGPWHLTCKSLSAFRATGQGVLLSASGWVRITGVIGLLEARADEATLNTENGDLKLTGHVRLELWDKPRELKSSTIRRTGEISETEP